MKVKIIFICYGWKIYQGNLINKTYYKLIGFILLRICEVSEISGLMDLDQIH